MDRFSFIRKFYFLKRMSDIEIQEMIERDAGVRFSRTAIKNWRDLCSMEARNPHQRFQLAVNKKRFDHSKVVQKIDYKARKINYRARNMTDGYKLRYSRIGYKWAINLYDLLDKYKKMNKDLAKSIGVSGSVISSWIHLKIRVNRLNQIRVANYFKIEPEKIFSDKKR